MLTRAGVARRLGRSIATVRRMEGHDLHPTIGVNGVHWFYEDEVDCVLEQREARCSSGPWGWSEGQRRVKVRRNAGCAAPQVQCQRPAVASRNHDGRELLRAIGERLGVALASLSERELIRIPEELLDAVSDVLAVVDG